MTSNDLDSMDADRRLSAWLDGLAGRSGAVDDVAQIAHRQGLLLRHLVLQRVQASDDASSQADEARVVRQWVQIRQRSSLAVGDEVSRATPAARAMEGDPVVLQHRPAANRWAIALAASVASLAVGMALSLRTLPPDGDEPEVVMRGLAAAVRLTPPAGGRAADFVGKATRILDSHQIKYQVTRLVEGYQIQFKLSAENPASTELVGLGMPVGNSGVFNFIILDPGERR